MHLREQVENRLQWWVKSERRSVYDRLSFVNISKK